jgi:hypothetical protein
LFAIRSGKEFLVPEVIRRPFAGALTTAGGLCALLVGLAAIDDRVRDQVARAFTNRGPTEEFATVGSRLNEMALIATRAVGDQSIEHAPMVIFALAAAILVVLMTRT